MDEVFHGHNPSEGTEPTGEILRVDTVMASAHKAHGGFRLHYSDTVLTCGNGRVWADWAVTGIHAGTLVALPYLAWFSQAHRLVLKFGWWELGLEIDGVPFTPHRVKTWYEADAIPVSEFYGGSLRVRSWCAAVPGQCRLVHALAVEGLDPHHQAHAVLRGATVLGEEAGSPYDAVNGTVGDHEPLPVALHGGLQSHALWIGNAAASLFAHLTSSVPGKARLHPAPEVVVRGPHRCDTKHPWTFELRCQLPAHGDTRELAIDLELTDGAPPVGDHPTPSLPEVTAAWRDEWHCLDGMSTPDPLLTAALRRAAVYAASLLPPVDETGTAAGLSDHVEWPVDCARDVFHIAGSLLFLRPDLVRRHLAFYFLEAIPAAGPGKSYVPKGTTRGHRDARLLDLAAYPLWHLWRYWRATGDDAFAAQPEVRDVVARVVDEVLTWRDERTGLLTSTERSSDEACVYPIFVPGNAMFAGALARMAELAGSLWGDPGVAARYAAEAASLRAGLWQHAVVDDPEYGRLFAFELGGPGKALLYEQADLPNLLSLPRYGFCATDDPAYRNTVRYAFGPRNQGYAGTADGKYRQLCDGSKTLPFSPWPLGALGQLLSGSATPDDAARLLDWLRDALTPALQLPEISDKHTALPVQRYWFGWPTAMLLMAFIEVICGVKLGDEPTIEPLVPAGWTDFTSPVLTVRGRTVRVHVQGGEVSIEPIGAITSGSSRDGSSPEGVYPE